VKAIEITGPTIDSLKTVEHPELAAPGPGRIQVRMKSGSLNFADLAVATGNYPGAPFPNIALADGAGEVVAVGKDVWQAAVGDRVAVHIKPRWIGGPATSELANAMRGATLPGSLVEVIDIDASSVVKVSDRLSYEEIGTLPVAAMTAWRALENGHVGPGSTVAILGTGGVSIFALQLAKARGARVLITSSSDEKLERARALGADVTVNYRTNPEWDQVALAETNGVGVDLVVDPVGGEGFDKSLSAVKHGGTVALFGFLGGGAAGNMFPVIFKEIRIQGTNGGSVADLAAAVAAIEGAGIKPVIDKTFSLADLTSAYELMAKGGHFGKIAITFDW